LGNGAGGALEQTVVWQLETDAAYETRTVETKPGHPVKEVRRAPTTTPSPLEDEVANTASEVNASDATPVSNAADRQSQAGGQVPQPAAQAINIVMLPVTQLQPNPWNPNTMTDEQERELQEEVRRLGRIPKPVTVRQLSENSFQIVDGEHNCKAAREAGHLEVPCEIIRVDDFEAMRQTFVRNRQGTRNPLLTGRLFQRMLELRGRSLEDPPTSQRRFAQEVNINEATLRNHLLYARAAGLRNRYAPETCDATITELSVAQVRKYLELPKDKRDGWLDRGANGDEADRILEEGGKKSKGPKERANTKTADSSPDDDAPEQAGAANGEEEDVEPTCVETDAGEEPWEADLPAADHEDETPAEPLSQAEQQVVERVLASYRDGRSLVRQRILAGLAADPEAVTFFRRMIESGT
jgi:ParB-like chromosome segregation protein Spo0J